MKCTDNENILEIRCVSECIYFPFALSFLMVGKTVWI